MPTSHKLIEHFWVIGPAFTRWAESHMHQNGLTPQRVRLLLLLKENGSVKMSEIRDRLGVSATNVTALVDVLETDKMVKRSPHPTDRRATMITITDHALTVLTENCGEFKDRVAEIFSEFSEKDQEVFVTLLSRMRDALVARGVLEPAAVSKTSVKEEEHA